MQYCHGPNSQNNLIYAYFVQLVAYTIYFTRQPTNRDIVYLRSTNDKSHKSSNKSELPYLSPELAFGNLLRNSCDTANCV